MQLSEALRLVRRIEPEAMRHRDHICSEAATHDLAHCPKMLSQIYAWRVESNIPAKPIWSYPVSVDGIGLRYKVSCR